MSDAVGMIESDGLRIEVETWTLWNRNHAVYPQEGTFAGTAQTAPLVNVTLDGRAHLSQSGSDLLSGQIRFKVRQYDPATQAVSGTFYPLHPIMRSDLTTANEQEAAVQAATVRDNENG